MTERVLDLLPDVDLELERVALKDFDAVGEELRVLVGLVVPDSLMDAEGVELGGITEFDFDTDLDKLIEVDILDEAVLVAVIELDTD